MEEKVTHSQIWKTRYTFSELFDIHEVQKLQDLFSAATGVASIITEPSGAPISKPSGFCSLCHIIRKTEIGRQNCRISASMIGLHNKEGPAVQRCLHGGLLIGGAAIIVAGQHIANWLVGQVLDEDYERKDLLKYADLIGVKREVYEEALAGVRRMSKAQFLDVCNFLFLNVRQLSELAGKNLSLRHEIKEKNSSEAEIKKLNSELELRIRERTAQLEDNNAQLEEINAALEEEMAKREKAEEELYHLNEELETKIIERTGQLQDLSTILEEELTKARKKREAENRYLSYHDALTGLYNRRFSEKEIKRLDTDVNLPISIILGDVNGLKMINDAFGHDKGDELLRKAAKAIQSACRKKDVVARWGGDEFVILLPETNKEETEKIVSRLKDLPANLPVNAVNLSMSFGWDTKKTKAEDILKVLKNAEDIMYKHKIIENKGMRGNIINTIINALHEKNPREEEHSKRVSRLCQDTGKAMGLSESEINGLKVAGLLHDIGKIAIEEGILNKPGKLTEKEWEQIKLHPDIGYRILNSSSEMSELADCILAHHERWDGKGYPKGLKGEEIPLFSRIISLADSYDAMVSRRSYREALSSEQALLEIQRNLGTQFDPEIAKIFLGQRINLISKPSS